MLFLLLQINIYIHKFVKHLGSNQLCLVKWTNLQSSRENDDPRWADEKLNIALNNHRMIILPYSQVILNIVPNSTFLCFWHLCRWNLLLVSLCLVLLFNIVFVSSTVLLNLLHFLFDFCIPFHCADITCFPLYWWTSLESFCYVNLVYICMSYLLLHNKLPPLPYSIG